MVQYWSEIKKESIALFWFHAKAGIAFFNFTNAEDFFRRKTPTS